MKTTPRDPSLPHQVVISHGRNVIQVSCNCRAQGGFGAGESHHVPFGTVKNSDDTKRLYNDPKNHDQSEVSFTEEFMLTYPDSTDVKKQPPGDAV